MSQVDHAIGTHQFGDQWSTKNAYQNDCSGALNAKLFGKVQFGGVNVVMGEPGASDQMSAPICTKTFYPKPDEVAYTFTNNAIQSNIPGALTGFAMPPIYEEQNVYTFNYPMVSANTAKLTGADVVAPPIQSQVGTHQFADQWSTQKAYQNQNQTVVSGGISMEMVHFLVTHELGMQVDGVHSSTVRATTVSAMDHVSGKRFVIRLSDPRSKPAARVMAFASHFAKEDTPGLVGMVPPRVSVMSGRSFFVQVYDLITFLNDCPVDMERFWQYCTTNADDKSASDLVKMMLLYSYQVITTISCIHEKSFCHMGISLENVVLSPTQAFVIHLESAADMRGQDIQYATKRDIQHGRSLKLQYCPIEHFEASLEHFVLLPGYDVWAWGVILFVTMFGEYLFDEVESGTLRRDQTKMFWRDGFDSYTKQFRPKAHEAMQNPMGAVAAVVDLLRRIFVVPTRREDTGVVCFDASERIRPNQIIEHHLWDLCHD